MIKTTLFRECTTQDVRDWLADLFCMLLEAFPEGTLTEDAGDALTYCVESLSDVDVEFIFAFATKQLVGMDFEQR